MIDDILKNLTSDPYNSALDDVKKQLYTKPNYLESISKNTQQTAENTQGIEEIKETIGKLENIIVALNIELSAEKERAKKAEKKARITAFIVGAINFLIAVAGIFADLICDALRAFFSK